MNLLQVISGLNINSGGPSQSVYNLTKGLRNNGADAQILTFASLDHKNIAVEDFIHVLPVSKFNFTRYSKLFLNFLEDNDYEIYHGHGIWQLPVHKTVQFTKKKNRPYIISPRGMLRPWALERSRLKKQIALKLYQKKDLVNAACLHATSQIEAIELKELGFKNPVAVIPNGIDLSEYPIISESKGSESKTILFLSRIYPKKGMEELIDAWSLIDKSIRKNWNIKVVGNGSEKYINGLRKLISEKKLENEIEFSGPKYGKEKINAFHTADIFVLPTHGENFGMAIAEALACGLPVITTKGAPWEELISYRAGWWIDLGVEPLAEALTKAMQLSDEERKIMGLNGRRLVEEKYSIDIVAKKMIELYEWILNKREKPEFII